MKCLKCDEELPLHNAYINSLTSSLQQLQKNISLIPGSANNQK